jgi:hypothetical protein
MFFLNIQTLRLRSLIKGSRKIVTLLPIKQFIEHLEQTAD